MIAKPSQAKPSQAKPSQAKPSQAKPSQAKPSQAKLCVADAGAHIYKKSPPVEKWAGFFMGEQTRLDETGLMTCLPGRESVAMCSG
ncbi:hypothetical protein [Alcaligenes faecalis]|uniref:hypothetical protein n=1 Tax=Alcaligenes faecalis TaxID=511 RepID=UPI0005A8CAF7|nr:hypothetical protein [Alcaligenes faecalis]MCX5593100.1 hypothetical protein [Alcaligenes faecalis]